MVSKARKQKNRKKQWNLLKKGISASVQGGTDNEQSGLHQPCSQSESPPRPEVLCKLTQEIDIISVGANDQSSDTEGCCVLSSSDTGDCRNSRKPSSCVKEWFGSRKLCPDAEGCCGSYKPFSVTDTEGKNGSHKPSSCFKQCQGFHEFASDTEDCRNSYKPPSPAEERFGPYKPCSDTGDCRNSRKPSSCVKEWFGSCKLCPDAEGCCGSYKPFSDTDTEGNNGSHKPSSCFKQCQGFHEFASDTEDCRNSYKPPSPVEERFGPYKPCSDTGDLRNSCKPSSCVKKCFGSHKSCPDAEGCCGSHKPFSDTDTVGNNGSHKPSSSFKQCQGFHEFASDTEDCRNSCKPPSPVEERFGPYKPCSDTGDLRNSCEPPSCVKECFGSHKSCPDAEDCCGSHKPFSDTDTENNCGSHKPFSDTDTENNCSSHKPSSCIKVCQGLHESASDTEGCRNSYKPPFPVEECFGSHKPCSKYAQEYLAQGGTETSEFTSCKNKVIHEAKQNFPLSTHLSHACNKKLSKLQQEKFKNSLRNKLKNESICRKVAVEDTSSVNFVHKKLNKIRRRRLKKRETYNNRGGRYTNQSAQKITVPNKAKNLFDSQPPSQRNPLKRPHSFAAHACTGVPCAVKRHKDKLRKTATKRTRFVNEQILPSFKKRKICCNPDVKPLSSKKEAAVKISLSLKNKSSRKQLKTEKSLRMQSTKSKEKVKIASKKPSKHRRAITKNRRKPSSSRKRKLRRRLSRWRLPEQNSNPQIEKNDVSNPTFQQLKVFSGRKLRRSVFSLSRNSEPKLVENLVKCCGGPSTAKQVLAKSLVKWCMVARRKLIWEFRQKHKNIRLKKCKHRLLVAERCCKWEECFEALLGPSRHIPSKESYFHETSYKTASFAPSPLAVERIGESMGGQIVNVFSKLQRTKTSFQWTCDSVCEIDRKKAYRAVKKVYTKISRTVTDNLMVHFLRDMNKCGGMCRYSNRKGHSLGCRIANKYNGAALVILQNLMPHFPVLRSLVDDLSKLKTKLYEIDALDFALQEGDLDTLEKIAEQTKLAGGEFTVGDEGRYTDEEAIIEKHFPAFVAYEKEMKELPRNYCFSCEKLLSQKSLVELNKMKSIPGNDKWNEIFQLKTKLGVCVDFICSFCLRKLRLNELPSVCTLNKMDVPEVPLTIQKLTSYERMFIQRAKAFQTVTKMGTVSGKNLPSSNLVPKVIGRTFHLPLPMEQTLDKVLKPHQAVMPNQELYFLLRGLPTKQKKIWETVINFTNILEALQWLKKNNPLYAEIELPNSVQELLDLLDDKEIPDDLNPDDWDDQDDPDDPDDPGYPDECNSHIPSHEFEQRVASPNMNAHRVENCDDVPKDRPVLCNENGVAMLTQKDQDDAFYQDFTVYPVYDKRENKLATEMYQMIKVVAETSLDSRTEKLDALCFPDLFPFGSNCFHENRKVDLQFYDFVKAKLLSRHSQFRTNIQYLFFLLNQANMRQLSAGIYQVLNVTREKLTAKEFLQKLERGDFEREMSSIFSRVRNTEAYWKIPRNRIRCMIEHYGSPTYFTTHSPADYADKELDNYLRDVLGEKGKGKSTSALVAMDPVSVARFMDRRLHALLAFWSSKANVMGEIAHYVWRREYQGRGTQHFHFLLWVKNAPMIGISTSEEIKDFIIQHFSCSIPDPKKFPELHRRVMSYQQHRDNLYCLRYKKVKSGKSRLRICRFSFPRSVGTKVIVRKPEVAIAGRRKLKANTRLIELPRKKSEVWTNDYNIPTLLVAEGNNDIQFIAEISRALGMYITKYQTKAEKSHMDDIFNDINSTRSLASRLWNIGLRGLVNRECGALEAADTLLSVALWGTDNETTFKWIDVNMFRSRKLKSREQIRSLDADDTDLYCPNLVDTHYPNRPKDLENLCLYDYVKHFDIIKAQPQKEDVIYYPYPDHGFLRKRKIPHLVDHYHYDPKQMPEKYHYALLLMFKPWRNIEELKGQHATYTEAFYAENLESAMQHHEKLSELRTDNEEITKLIQKATKIMDNEEKDVGDKDNEENQQFAECEANNAMQEFRAAANDNNECYRC